MSAKQISERRRDPRIPATAQVRMAPSDDPRGDVAANLLDVSAGGLRARCSQDSGMRVGTEVVVEIRLNEDDVGSAEAKSPIPPSVDLRGLGVIVRLGSPTGRKQTCEAALRFIGPLTMREPFANMLLF